jgi:hypothetical protein
MSDNPVLQLVQAGAFLPTASQIRARRKFWESNPGLELEPDAELPQVLSYAPTHSVRKVIEGGWRTPGFVEWMLMPQYSLYESERLLQAAMQELERVLLDPTSATDRRIAAAKEARAINQLLTEQSGAGAKFADEVVSDMTPEQLREFIRRNSIGVS